MPGGAEGDLLGGIVHVGDDVVVGGDDLIDVDEVLGLCKLTSALVHAPILPQPSGEYSWFMAIPSYPGHFSARVFDPPGVVPEGYVLLDIREANEWAAGHAPGAVHLPLSRIPGHLDELPKGDIILICRSGNRSATLMDWLITQGHRVWNVRDGMIGWKVAGYPVVRDDGQPGQII